MKLSLAVAFLLSMSIFAFAKKPKPVRPIAKPSPSPTPSPPLTSSTPPPPVYPVALPNYNEETATRLQIFLDNSDFGPGKIDGKMGEFFRKALISYKHALAMPKTGAVDSWLLDQVPVTYTNYT